MQDVLIPTDSQWYEVSKGNQTARMIADRHYSRQSVGDKQFVGPGHTMVLLSYDNKALFVWRFSGYRDDGQDGVECAIFRNEGELKSSDLILEAEQFAWVRWPDKRLFTYVDGEKIKSTYPGFCFKCAGWKKVNGYRSKVNALHLLEKHPDNAHCGSCEIVTLKEEV